MNEHTAKAFETASIALACAGTVSAVVYFIVAVWWAGWVEGSTQTELARHETCYERWYYNEAHQERWLAENYCGDKETSE